MKLYGIPNCNTVKKARAWLTENGIAIPFHDFRKQGISEELLKSWMKQISWEKLVNRQGTTWRQLPDEAKAAVCDESSAIRLMLEKSGVIKRPVLEMDGKITLGFDEAAYQSLFGIK
ncbi:MAG: ArsC family reductase [Sulfuricella sp.]|nr:ArsC family reductase [Sulfuricella sp.]